MRHLTLATTQFACSWSLDDNLDRAERLVREAAARGAQLVLLQELFATPYFCIEQDHRHLRLAETFRGSRVLARFSSLARELGVVLPLSWYERAGNARFNSLAVADADGRLLGVYRKAHVPNAIGYQEKEYFSPGIAAFASGTPRSAVSASASAGTSGFPRPRAAWRCWAPRCCCFLPPSAPSLAPRSWIPAITGRSPSAARPPPTWYRWWLPTGSAARSLAATRRWPCGSTVRPSSPTTGCLARRGRPRRGGGAGLWPRPRCDRRRTPGLGCLS